MERKIRLFLFDKNEKNRFNMINLFFIFFAILLVASSFLVLCEDAILFVVLFGCGLFFFPGIPLILRCYKKAYYIELLDDYIICRGTLNNLFGKRKISYDEIYYLETGNQEPVIYPRGTNREQMVREFGSFTNVYNKDREFLFSFRNNSMVTEKIFKKNNRVQIVDSLR